LSCPIFWAFIEAIRSVAAAREENVKKFLTALFRRCKKDGGMCGMGASVGSGEIRVTGVFGNDVGRGAVGLFVIKSFKGSSVVLSRLVIFSIPCPLIDDVNVSDIEGGVSCEGGIEDGTGEDVGIRPSLPIDINHLLIE
jgi:hypothetical protein